MAEESAGALVPVTEQAALMEAVLVKGDLAKLTPDERNRFYMETCRSLGLNPLTKPFDYLTLNGRMVMYAKRDAADQLRKLNGVNIEITDQRVDGQLYQVTVRATDRTGRVDEDMGVVVLPQGGAPEIRANAILKAITKAKRRVTLSICGLGFLDETEVEDIPSAAKLLPLSRRPRVTQNVTTATKPELPEAQNQDAGVEGEIEKSLRAAAALGLEEFKSEWDSLHPNYRKKFNALKDELKASMQQ